MPVLWQLAFHTHLCLKGQGLTQMRSELAIGCDRDRRRSRHQWLSEGRRVEKLLGLAQSIQAVSFGGYIRHHRAREQSAAQMDNPSLFAIGGPRYAGSGNQVAEAG